MHELSLFTLIVQIVQCLVCGGGEASRPASVHGPESQLVSTGAYELSKEEKAQEM